MPRTWWHCEPLDEFTVNKWNDLIAKMCMHAQEAVTIVYLYYIGKTLL